VFPRNRKFKVPSSCGISQTECTLPENFYCLSYDPSYMNPTDETIDPKSGPPTRSTLAFKSIRSNINNRISESPQDIGRPTSVLHSAFPLGSTTYAAPTLRAARSTVLPTLTVPAARSSAAPTSFLENDVVFLSTVLADLAQNDVVELITLPAVPTWVPKGFSTTSFLRSTLTEVLRSTPQPIRVARTAAELLSSAQRDSFHMSALDLPDCFHSLSSEFPTYSPDEPHSFWHLARGFLLVALRKFDAAFYYVTYHPRSLSLARVSILIVASRLLSLSRHVRLHRFHTSTLYSTRKPPLFALLNSSSLNSVTMLRLQNASPTLTPPIFLPTPTSWSRILLSFVLNSPTNFAVHFV
jgi:hypothetical protein